MRTQETGARTIDELIAKAEMERMARLFLKRRSRGRNQLADRRFV